MLAVMRTNLAKLIDEIRAFDRLPALERARRARELSAKLRAAAGADGDSAVYEATRGQTYADVAEALGIAQVTVDRAVQRHRRQSASA
jgi:hypothetical protein